MYWQNTPVFGYNTKPHISWELQWHIIFWLPVSFWCDFHSRLQWITYLLSEWLKSQSLATEHGGYIVEIQGKAVKRPWLSSECNITVYDDWPKPIYITMNYLLTYLLSEWFRSQSSATQYADKKKEDRTVTTVWSQPTVVSYKKHTGQSIVASTRLRM